MDYAWIKASAPGSLMLMGEHAVLQGESSLAMAVDTRLTVTLRPREDKNIIVHSNHFPTVECSIENIASKSSQHFVFSVLNHFRDEIHQGLTIEIDSHINPTYGLGSSAALVVAMSAALLKGFRHTKDLKEIYNLSKNCIRYVQGQGSGMDALASTYGGIVYYDPMENYSEMIPVNLPFHAVYAGYKTPTVEVIKKVQEAFSTKEMAFSQLVKSLGECAREGFFALKQEDFKTFGHLMNEHQNLQEKLGVSDDTLREILLVFNSIPTILGAKISGAGLGDCVLALGELEKDPFNTPMFSKRNIKLLPITSTHEGVILDY